MFNTNIKGHLQLLIIFSSVIRLKIQLETILRNTKWCFEGA